MPAARVVRIAAPRPLTTGEVPSHERPPTGASMDWVENRSGTQRAVRTYVAFLAALVSIYSVFLLSLATAPYPGVRSGATGYGLLSLTLALMAAYGFGLTILRAPRTLRRGANELWVRERTGRVHHVPMGPGYGVSVLKRYAAGPFSEEPTEMVKLSMGGGTDRIYLVDRGFFPDPPGVSPV